MNKLKLINKIKNDKNYKYRLISSNYWRWHWKWNIFVFALLSILATFTIIENLSDGLFVTAIVITFLCIFSIVAKITYDTDRWDMCIKCGYQYNSEEKHCSNCGTIREGNTIDGITWRKVTSVFTFGASLDTSFSTEGKAASPILEPSRGTRILSYMVNLLIYILQVKFIYALYGCQ